MTRLWMLLLLPLVANGATEPNPPMSVSTTSPTSTSEPTRVGHSMFAKNAVPESLLKVVAEPYARPADTSCDALAVDITALNDILGEDLDALNPTDADHRADQVIDTVQGFIPYHGWLRRLSGATARERRLLAAMAAGAVRRAYLKGLGEAQGCSPPAAPKREQDSPPAK